MSHRHHLVWLAAAAGLFVWFLVAGSGSTALAGVSLALLICPLVMGVVMWLLMRQPQAASRQSERDPNEEQPAVGRR
jgi:hypothetical protein